MENLVFREPPPDVDETWTHGAMFGGMCGYGDDDIAEAYFALAERAIDAVLKGDEDGPRVVNPVMFLYRHAMELYLKIIVGPRRTHDLSALFKAFRIRVADRYNQAIPSWLSELILEFHEYDPDSDVFRYSQTRCQHLQQGGEYWVDLRSLHRRMRSLRRALRRVMWAEANDEMPHHGVGA